MRRGGEALVGKHDFAAFQSSGGDVQRTERTILSLDVGPDRGETGFRRGTEELPPIAVMVRSIAGKLVDVGLGRWPPGYVADILASRDRRRAGRAAPACGLFLVRVDYD